MSSRWVDVRVDSRCKQLIIMDFLLGIALRPRLFKSDDLVEYDKKALNFKSSMRFLRDLRFKGLIRYEVTRRSEGVYKLNSSYAELIEAKSRIEEGGYWIDEEMPVLINSDYSTDIEQLKLL